MTAFVIAGALSWIGRWYQSGGEYSAAQVAEQCIGTLMHGVLGRAVWLQRAGDCFKPFWALALSHKRNVLSNQ